jgi:hypothetical protein
MANDVKERPSSSAAQLVALGKDSVALVRDATLFSLALLLVAFPTYFNSMLVSAGFEEGSIVGFKWKAGLLAADSALQTANRTIAQLQAKNDELVQTLREMNTKLADPTFHERVAALERGNEQVQASANRANSNITQTLHSNAVLVDKARQSAAGTQQSARRPLSDYLVGVQTLGAPDEYRQELNAKLRAAGYSLHDISSSFQVSDRPNWFAQRPTVFYYHPAALQAARDLASLLKDWTGEEFQVQSGNGLGVDPSQRDVTLFVHYLKR